MPKADDLDKQAVVDALKAELEKTEQARKKVAWNLEQAQREAQRLSERSSELQRAAALAGDGTLVSALDDADMIATGMLGKDFSPTDSLRLDLVQGLKEGDFRRMCMPSVPDKTCSLKVTVLKKPSDDYRPLEQREEWHALVILRRMRRGEEAVSKKDDRAATLEAARLALLGGGHVCMVLRRLRFRRSRLPAKLTVVRARVAVFGSHA
jgi:hypothetical protein